MTQSKLFSSGLAAGRWILTRDFVDESRDQQRWASPLNYVIDEVTDGVVDKFSTSRPDLLLKLAFRVLKVWTSPNFSFADGH